MRNRDDDNYSSSNISSIFKGLDKFINIMADMIESEKKEIDIKGTINNPEKDKKITGNYGVNIKFGVDRLSELDRINTLSNINRQNNISGRIVKSIENVEPPTDIFDEPDKVTIVMELPGVAEDDIEVEIDENIIKIRAEGHHNCYSKNISLKFNPKEEVQARLNNSIYSIVIKK